MEINLQRDSVSYYSKVLSIKFSKEETAENIVPDTLPDIGTVLDADAAAILRSKDISDGRISVGGMVFGFIIYKSEDENELIRMPVQLPFSANWENSGILQSSKAIVKLELSSFEGRIINSRKLLLRAEIVISADVYNKEICEYTSGAESDALELLHDKIRFNHVSAVGERTFNISEELQLPVGSPNIERIVKYRSRLCREEINPVGSRLILKGRAIINLLYRTEGEKHLRSVELQIPFSQIYDSDCSHEITSAEAVIMQTGCFIDTNSYEDKPANSVRIEIGAVAQFCVWSELELECLCDAYSTQHEIIMKLEDSTLRESRITGSREETFTYTINIPGGVKSITDCYAFIGRQRGENGSHAWPISIKMLFENEDGDTAAASADYELHNILRDKATDCSAEIMAISIRPSPEGAEIKLEAKFIMQYEEEISFATPSEICIDEETDKNSTSQPSIVVLRADGSTTLWRMAKAFNTTVSNINDVNPGLNNDIPSKGELLLIAKKR